MAYNLDLADRVEEAMARCGYIGPNALKMFGGICYTVNGNIACGVIRDQLIVRVGKQAYQASLEKEGVNEFDITGRAMRGWVMVDLAAVSEDQALLDWVARGVSFAASLEKKV